MTRVNDWSLVPAVLVARMVKEYGEPVVDGGPLPTVLSVPLESRVAMLDGRLPPTMLKVGAGKPVALTRNVPGWLTAKCVSEALVICGAWLTVSVNDCEEAAPTPLLACTVR